MTVSVHISVVSDIYRASRCAPSTYGGNSKPICSSVKNKMYRFDNSI